MKPGNLHMKNLCKVLIPAAGTLRDECTCKANRCLLMHLLKKGAFFSVNAPRIHILQKNKEDFYGTQKTFYFRIGNGRSSR